MTKYTQFVCHKYRKEDYDVQMCLNIDENDHWQRKSIDSKLDLVLHP
jgi:hypothetical protein